MYRRYGEYIALFILLVVVGLRPLVSESFSTASTPMVVALDGVQDAWASATLIIDAVIFAVVGGILLLRGGGRKRQYRLCGLELGILLLFLAAVVSCFAAGHKRPAINASFDLLASVVLAVGLVQLLDKGWKLRLAIAVVVASGVANVAECLEQHFVSFAETQEHYETIRDQYWAEQGVPLDSPTVALYERRMAAREATGYFFHSNIAGGYLLLAGFAALGMAWAYVKSRSGEYAAVILWLASAMAIASAVAITGSVGAIGAGLVGLGVLVVRLLFCRPFESHPRLIWGLGWAGVVFAILAAVGHGLHHGSLPGASLNFRWQYWTASAPMVADHWMTGVGGENFGDYYLEHKSIESPEEVKNPHNFLVQFACEYGVIGLLAALAMLVGGAWYATRGVLPPDEDCQETREAEVSSRQLLLWGGAIGVAVFLVRIPLLPSNDSNLIIWTTSFPAIFWFLAIGSLAFGSMSFEPERAHRRTLAIVINCGLLAFLLQDLVNFALFVPGARTTFFALLAVAIALRCSDSAAEEAGERRADTANSVAMPTGILAGVYLLFVAALAWSIVSPIKAEYWQRHARASLGERASSIDVQPGHVSFGRATEADSLDGEIPAEHAGWLTHVAEGVPDDMREHVIVLGLGAIDVALARAPRKVGFWRRKSRLHLMAGQVTGDADHFDSAVESMRMALKLYPQQPRNLVNLGDCLVAKGDEESLAEAIESYEEALAMDSRRPEWELFAGFTEKDRNDVELRLQAVRDLLVSAQSPSSQDDR